MGLFTSRKRRTTWPDAAPPPVPVETAAGAAAVGNPAGSGKVAPWNQLQPYYGPGLVPSSAQQLDQGDPSLTDLPPDSLYQDRPLYGGVQTLTAFDEYVAPPPFAGGFVVMANRPPLAMIEGEQMGPQTFEAPASWRDAPAVVDLCRRIPTEVANG